MNARIWSVFFDGHWPVGSAMVVIAATEPEARAQVELELERNGLLEKNTTADGNPDWWLTELRTDVAKAHMLCDGNY